MNDRLSVCIIILFWTTTTTAPLITRTVQNGETSTSTMKRKSRKVDRLLNEWVQLVSFSHFILILVPCKPILTCDCFIGVFYFMKWSMKLFTKPRSTYELGLESDSTPSKCSLGKYFALTKSFNFLKQYNFLRITWFFIDSLVFSLKICIAKYLTFPWPPRRRNFHSLHQKN